MKMGHVTGRGLALEDLFGRRRWWMRTEGPTQSHPRLKRFSFLSAVPNNPSTSGPVASAIFSSLPNVHQTQATRRIVKRPRDKKQMRDPPPAPAVPRVSNPCRHPRTQMGALLPSLLPSPEFGDKRERVRATLERNLMRQLPEMIPRGSTLRVFGSSSNGFGNDGADLDM